MLTQPVGTGGCVWSELRVEPSADADNPAAGCLDLEALTNPIFLVQGTEPADKNPWTHHQIRVAERRCDL